MSGSAWRFARAVAEHLGRAGAAYGVLMVGVALTLLATRYVSGNVEAQERVRFDEAASAARDAMDRRVDSYVDLTFGARGLFAASEAVERAEWRGYVESIDLEGRYGGVQAMGYVSRVSGPEELDAFEDGLPGVVRPGGERAEYYPIEYVEPMNAANESLLGYDAYREEPEHRVTMDRARDTGEPQTTGRVFVLSEAPPGSLADLALEPGLVAYLPVYRQDEPQGTVAERRRALEGFVVCYMTVEELFRGVQEGRPSAPSIDFEVYDDEESFSPAHLLYDNDGVLRAGDAQEMPVGNPLVGAAAGAIRGVTGLPVGEDGSSDLNALDSFGAAGREWNVYFEALPEFQMGEEGRLPLFVFLSGLGVSLLLFGTTYVLVRNRVRAERASRELEDANRELEATNRELEAFSYSVSHDLRAPLRSIDGFSQILLEDYGDELDEEGKEHLGRVRASSQRMGRLIDDLLGLSRVTRGSLRREKVDFSSIAREVAETLRDSRPERGVEFLIEDGLEVWGDARLIRVALENLLGNAFKFTAKRSRARIEFGVDPELTWRGRVPVYYVRDNGAGFDMAYAGKLFGAFQRLHAQSEFDGTGIGLATVQRIVHRHGGRIWAESEVEEGAAFFFTLRPGLQLDPSAPRGAKDARGGAKSEKARAG